MAHGDILEQLQIDPGRLTLGQLLQERERAAHEIQRLRYEVQHLHDAQVRARSDFADETKTAAMPRALIRLSEVYNIVGLSRSTIYLRLSQGLFPQPVRIGSRTVRWRMEDIEAWKAGFER